MAEDDDKRPVERLRRGAGNRKGRNRKPADDAAEARWAARREQCVRLRSSGFTWREIAEALGYSDTGNAYRDFQKALKARPAEAVDEMRARSNEALEIVIRGQLNKARNGDSRCAEAVVKAIAQHAKMNGYEAPQVHELMGKGGGPIESRFSLDEVLAVAAQNAGGDKPTSGE